MWRDKIYKAFIHFYFLLVLTFLSYCFFTSLTYSLYITVLLFSACVSFGIYLCILCILIKKYPAITKDIILLCGYLSAPFICIFNIWFLSNYNISDNSIIGITIAYQLLFTDPIFGQGLLLNKKSKALDII